MHISIKSFFLLCFFTFACGLCAFLCIGFAVHFHSIIWLVPVLAIIPAWASVARLFFVTLPSPAHQPDHINLGKEK